MAVRGKIPLLSVVGGFLVPAGLAAIVAEKYLIGCVLSCGGVVCFQIGLTGRLFPLRESLTKLDIGALSEEPLPEARPKVTIARFARGRDGGNKGIFWANGFWLKNEGTVAYDVTIDDIPLAATQKLVFERLTRLQSEEFVRMTATGGSPVFDRTPDLGEKLLELCDKRGKMEHTTDVILRYRDFDGRTYKSIHNVTVSIPNPNLEIRFVRQVRTGL